MRKLTWDEDGDVCYSQQISYPACLPIRFPCRRNLPYLGNAGEAEIFTHEVSESRVPSRDQYDEADKARGRFGIGR